VRCRISNTKQVGVRLHQSFELKQFSVTKRRKEVGKLFQSHAAMSQYCNFVIKRLNVKRARSTVFWLHIKPITIYVILTKTHFLTFSPNRLFQTYCVLVWHGNMHRRRWNSEPAVYQALKTPKRCTKYRSCLDYRPIDGVPRSITTCKFVSLAPITDSAA